MKKLKQLIIAILLLTNALLFSGCVAKVALPTVKEGRFNFSVTYEINGEEKTYSGVYVCKFDGVYITFLGGSIKWKGYIENEEEIDIPVQTKGTETVYLNFGLFPEYFMSDPDAAYYDDPEPSLYMVYYDEEFDTYPVTADPDVIANCGVKIISYEYAAPIPNTFKEKLTFGHFEPTIN